MTRVQAQRARQAASIGFIPAPPGAAAAENVDAALAPFERWNRYMRHDASGALVEGDVCPNCGSADCLQDTRDCCEGMERAHRTEARDALRHTRPLIMPAAPNLRRQ